MSAGRYPYVHVSVPEQDAELMSDRLWMLGAQGIEERDQTTMSTSGDDRVLLVASFDAEDDAHRAVAQLPVPARVHVLLGDEWRHEWKKYFKPSKVGPRLWVRPSWEQLTAEPGDVVIMIDPGGAFGSGIHETTRLVLREIDRRTRGGESVLDVGCGSGILAVGTLLLGARQATAVDIDEDAVRIAAENAALNGVADRLRCSTTDVKDIPERFDLVLANIQASVLIEMAPVLTARVGQGGTLVLSGILDGQEEDVAAAFPMWVESMPQEGEWRAIVLRG